MIDGLMKTNGRIASWIQFFDHTEGHRISGLGTGGISRYILQSGHVFGGEPHNDYLRIFADQGTLGFILFLSIGAGLVFKMRHKYILGIILAFGVCLITDNILVYPTCGYGPLLLLGLAGMDKESL